MVEMAKYYQKMIYRDNGSPIKISKSFFTVEKAIQNFIRKRERSKMAKASNKSKANGITVLYFKLYYKAAVIKNRMILAQK